MCGDFDLTFFSSARGDPPYFRGLLKFFFTTFARPLPIYICLFFRKFLPNEGTNTQ